MPTRKIFGPIKYPREKILDPRKHDGTIARDPREAKWHGAHGIYHTLWKLKVALLNTGKIPSIKRNIRSASLCIFDKV